MEIYESSEYSECDDIGEWVAVKRKRGLTGKTSEIKNARKKSKEKEFLKKKQPTLVSYNEKALADVNYLRINYDKMISVCYQYEILIVPNYPNAFVRRVFNQFHKTYFPNYGFIFDGKRKVFSTNVLPTKNSPFLLKFVHDDYSSNFKVHVKACDNQAVNMKPIIDYINGETNEYPASSKIVLDMIFMNDLYIYGERSNHIFFSKDALPQYDIGDNREIVSGLHQCVRLIQNRGLFLNIDTQHLVSTKPIDLIDYLRQEYPNIDLNSKFPTELLACINDFLKHMHVIYQPPHCFARKPRPYFIHKVLEISCSDTMFEYQNQELTVAAYFEMRGYPLQYPDSNCLHMKPAESTNFLPIELCVVLPRQMHKISGEKLYKLITKNSVTTPDVRMQKIDTLIKHFKLFDQKSVERFGFSISNQFEKIPYFIQRSPYLEIYNGVKILPSLGKWSITTHPIPYSNGKIPNGIKHALLYYDNGNLNYDQMKIIAKKLLVACEKKKIILRKGPLIKSFTSIDEEIKNLKMKGYHVAFVILSKNDVKYEDVKRAGDIKYGLLTQCIDDKIDPEHANSTYNGIAYKLNIKFNGINHKVVDLIPSLKNVMFAGADLCHPMYRSSNIPTMVGFVYTYDADGTYYRGIIKAQSSTKEDIYDMEDLISKALRSYFESRKRYPDYIFYYRDGVSRGTIPKLKKTEVNAIRAVLKKLRINTKLICLLVVKRHRTRFFVKNIAKDGRAIAKNIGPGSIVDETVVSDLEWFMISHNASGGTIKPVRIEIIENDANFSKTFLQKLSYNLCHVLSRSTHVPSIPTPVWLADTLAARGILYIDEKLHLNVATLEEINEKIKIHPDLLQHYPLYFF